MSQESVRVLLLGEHANGSSYLLRRLETLGCDCSFATSTLEAASAAGWRPFHLILSTSILHESDPLLGVLGERNCTVFYSFPVEDGCWWLPLVRNGQRCLGRPALRPSEFVGFLDGLVKEIEISEMTPQTPQKEAAAIRQ